MQRVSVLDVVNGKVFGEVEFLETSAAFDTVVLFRIFVILVGEAFHDQRSGLVFLCWSYAHNLTPDCCIAQKPKCAAMFGGFLSLKACGFGWMIWPSLIVISTWSSLSSSRASQV